MYNINIDFSFVLNNQFNRDEILFILNVLEYVSGNLESYVGFVSKKDDWQEVEIFEDDWSVKILLKPGDPHTICLVSFEKREEIPYEESGEYLEELTWNYRDFDRDSDDSEEVNYAI